MDREGSPRGRLVPAMGAHTSPETLEDRGEALNVRANEHPIGTTLVVEGATKYHAPRVLGTVEYDERGRHAFYGGELDDGTREASVAGSVRIREARRLVSPAHETEPSEPDPELAERAADRAADDYDRALEARYWRRYGG